MVAEPIEIGTARKPFRRDGMGWLWDVPNTAVRFRVDYLGVRADELYGEIRVTLDDHHLHLARFNLSSTHSRETLVRALSRTTQTINWARYVEQFCVGVLERERAGSATQYTSEAPKRRLQYLVDKLIIRNKTNMLFAPGGSGKGFLTVGLCCAVSTRRGLADLCAMEATPFYFDWEDDFETFEDRMNTVARGMNVNVPHVAYRRMRGLAADHINEMARAMSEANATFGVIDSFSAAGGTTDRTSWDTVAHRLFDALDQIPDTTWLIIDHVSGENLKDPSGKAFGSIQKMNRVRNAWEVRSDQEAGDNLVHMKFFDAKWNHTGKRTAFAIDMEFSAESVVFTGAELERPASRIATSNATRMGIQLAVRPMYTDELAKAIKVSEGTIRVELSRNARRFRRDADGLIHLVREDAEESIPW